jgi:hypothetical protein
MEQESECSVQMHKNQLLPRGAPEHPEPVSCWQHKPAAWKSTIIHITGYSRAAHLNTLNLGSVGSMQQQCNPA